MRPSTGTPFAFTEGTMPSQRHEALVQLIHDRPSLLLACGDAVAKALPRSPLFEVLSETVKQQAPRVFACDLALLARGRRPQDCVVVLNEVQLKIDEAQRIRWAVKLAGLELRHRCRAVLVVITPSASVANWAKRLRPPDAGALSLDPIVIGPDAIPLIATAKQARAAPELALLSAIAHASRDRDAAHAKRVVKAVRSVEPALAMGYISAILDALPKAARRALEADVLRTQPHQLNPILRRVIDDARTEGRQEGEARGRQEGRQEGEARGRQAGWLEALGVQRRSLTAILDARGLAISAEQRARIDACEDAEVLACWIVQAAVAAHSDGVFG